LTLGIGGVGVMNIMLVSVDERIREIGLRRALGARKRHIKLQFLAETLLIMLLGGAIGVLLSYAIAAAVGTLPLMGPLFEDESGKADIHLKISTATVMLSSLVLLAVGVVSGLVPALRAVLYHLSDHPRQRASRPSARSVDDPQDCPRHAPEPRSAPKGHSRCLRQRILSEP